jgi:hypothetical protein
MSQDPIDLSNRRLFTPVTNPESDVTSYVLTRKVAPVQEAFYFTNDSISADGRYLWFYTAFPPSASAAHGRTLGVLDFETQEVRHFPDTQFGEASPYLATESGEIYWNYDRYVWKRGPQADGAAELVNAVPDDLIRGRQVLRAATHLTRSADGKEFFIDLGLQMQWLFGSLPLNGGDFQLWHRFDRLYNHAQFSPTDPNAVLFAEEFHSDPITGLTFPVVNRLWHIQRGGQPRPILQEPVAVTHEWWDPDGEHVWCTYKTETWRVRVSDGAVEKIAFPHHCWHSFSSQDGRWLVCDSIASTPWQRGGRSNVYFLNRDSGQKITLANNPERADYAGRNYHIDPHPRFCLGDRYVVFTTTVLGAVDVAIVPTAALLAKTQ